MNRLLKTFYASIFALSLAPMILQADSTLSSDKQPEKRVKKAAALGTMLMGIAGIRHFSSKIEPLIKDINELDRQIRSLERDIRDCREKIDGAAELAKDANSPHAGFYNHAGPKESADLTRLEKENGPKIEQAKERHAALSSQTKPLQRAYYASVFAFAGSLAVLASESKAHAHGLL